MKELIRYLNTGPDIFGESPEISEKKEDKYDLIMDC